MRGFIRVSIIGIALLAFGCDDPQAPTDSSQKKEEQSTEDNQQRLINADPIPQFDKSLERENLIARLKTLNVQNKTGYVYLIGYGGEVIAQYTVRGKVSSLNSYLTTDQQIVARSFGTDMQAGAPHTDGFVVGSPDLDGSYGKNPEGIFFYTTDGTYVEWSGGYLYADKPLKVMTAVKLEATVDLNKQGN